MLFQTAFADATVAYEKSGENVKKQQFNWACRDTRFQLEEIQYASISDDVLWAVKRTMLTEIVFTHVVEMPVVFVHRFYYTKLCRPEI